MAALPTSDWLSRPLTSAEARAAAPAPADWRAMGEIEHVFTHFSLTLSILRAEVSGDLDGATWTPLAQAGEGLPSVFLKALRAGLGRLV
jgi:A/G-specific adenine glycosylase